MNEKIDVLAVMDFRIDQAVSNWRYHGQDDGPEPDSIIVFRQARAAIAELIEADKEYDKAYAAAVANPAKEAWLADAEERRAAAIARVGGA